MLWDTARAKASHFWDDDLPVTALRASDDGPDHGLAHAIRAGDEQAFTAFVQQHVTSLVRFAYAFLKSRDDAEDVVQEVFWNIWRRHAEWAPPPDTRTYLLAAIRNRCLNRLEHAQVHQRYATSVGVLHPEFAQDVDRHLEDTERRAIVEHAVAELPAPQREAVTLRYQQQLSYKEGAAVMGISAKAFEMHLARARARLAPLVERLRR
jgi:RNA polymerase sigma-70 factor (ECF subfamily)